MKLKDLLNIPNIITNIRILLMPIYVYMSMTAQTPEQYKQSAYLLLFMAFTDLLDGYIARSYNMVTELGKFLDPLADKLFQLAIVVSLVNRVEGMWIVFAVFMLKEFILAGLSCYYYTRYKRKMDGAMWCGKVSSSIFYGMTFLMVLLPPLDHVYYFVMEVFMIVGLMIAFIRYGIFYYGLHTDVKRGSMKD